MNLEDPGEPRIHRELHHGEPRMHIREIILSPKRTAAIPERAVSRECDEFERHKIEIVLPGGTESAPENVELLEIVRLGATEHVKKVLRNAEVDKERNVQNLYLASTNRLVAFYRLGAILAVRCRANSGLQSRFSAGRVAGSGTSWLRAWLTRVRT